METKINIAELLKDCPQGMELDCIIFNNPVKYESANDDGSYPISICTEEGELFYLNKYGCLYDRFDSKCAIFPKGKTTWDGFVPPCRFKDGDIVYIKTKGYNQNKLIIIFKEIKNDHIHKHACFAYQVLYTDKNAVCHLVDVEEIRLATEDEKIKLFDSIKANGYKWNPETKTLDKLPKFKVGDTIKDEDGCEVEITKVDIDKKCYEYQILEYPSMKSIGIGIILFDDQNNWKLVPNKLVQPKFKVGDRIKQIGSPRCYIIKTIEFDRYVLNNNQFIRFVDEHIYELVPNKFDITTLKPFDRVLTRDCNEDKWSINFFGRYRDNGTYQCMTFTKNQCIPYNDSTKHLIDTTDDCDEYYKTW